MFCMLFEIGYQIIQLQLTLVMLLRQSCLKLFKSPVNLYFPTLAYQVTVSAKKLNTEVFSNLSYSEIANPRLTKFLITKPIHQHSRVSQRSLYHKKRVSGIIRSCFSEKKHKVFRRVQKLKKEYYSDILQRNIFVTLSRKAFRTILKMGSFDNYILCTKPKDLDSKYGEYLRELMLRKINDSNFRVPYIIGTNRKLRIKNYSKHLYMQQTKRLIIPKQYKAEMRTFQRKFGKTPQQLNNADYAKYLELQTLKKNLGDQLEPTHPLLVELKQKMNQNLFTKQEQQRLEKMSKEAQQSFLNDPKNGQANRKRFEKIKKETQILNLKLLEMRFRMNANAAIQQEEAENKKQLVKAGKDVRTIKQSKETKDDKDPKEGKSAKQSKSAKESAKQKKKENEKQKPKGKQKKKKDNQK